MKAITKEFANWHDERLHIFLRLAYYENIIDIASVAINSQFAFDKVIQHPEVNVAE